MRVQLGSAQQGLTELIKGLKDPIKRIAGLDRGDILPEHMHILCSVCIEGPLIKEEDSSRGLLSDLF